MLSPLRLTSTLLLAAALLSPTTLAEPSPPATPTTPTTPRLDRRSLFHHDHHGESHNHGRIGAFFHHLAHGNDRAGHNGPVVHSPRRAYAYHDHYDGYGYGHGLYRRSSAPELASAPKLERRSPHGDHHRHHSRIGAAFHDLVHGTHDHNRHGHEGFGVPYNRLGYGYDYDYGYGGHYLRRRSLSTPAAPKGASSRLERRSPHSYHGHGHAHINTHVDREFHGGPYPHVHNTVHTTVTRHRHGHGHAYHGHLFRRSEEDKSDASPRLVRRAQFVIPPAGGVAVPGRTAWNNGWQTGWNAGARPGVVPGVTPGVVPGAPAGAAHGAAHGAATGGHFFGDADSRAHDSMPGHHSGDADDIALHGFSWKQWSGQYGFGRGGAGYVAGGEGSHGHHHHHHRPAHYHHNGHIHYIDE